MVSSNLFLLNLYSSEYSLKYELSIVKPKMHNHEKRQRRHDGFASQRHILGLLKRSRLTAPGPMLA
jgi:hypothetical protein